MLRKMLSAKIHRATVTHADLDYEGSISIPPELLRLTGIKEYEAVNVWNVTSGTRFETYAISGLPASSDICVNGAAAHLVSLGDIVIIASFVQMDDEQASVHKPKVVFVDKFNKVRELRSELAGPQVAQS